MKIRCTISFLLIALILLTGVVAAVDAPDDKDPTTAWKRWPSIEAAIVLRDLDGPEDIIEKAEIIEDRIDDLAREKERLDKEIAVHEQKIQALRNQREVLHDLAEIRLGGDSQTRQRLQEIAERLRKQKLLAKEKLDSLSGLKAELTRLKELASTYREKAKQLHIEEGGLP